MILKSSKDKERTLIEEENDALMKKKSKGE